MAKGYKVIDKFGDELHITYFLTKDALIDWLVHDKIGDMTWEKMMIRPKPEQLARSPTVYKTDMNWGEIKRSEKNE
jgi:hypothetical protein